MIEPSETQPMLTRRRFGVLALGTAGALAAGAVATVTIFDGDDDDATPRAFELYYDPTVYVTMTNGHPFVVEVKEHGTGTVLEHHGAVTATNLFSLESEYIDIAEVAVPG